MQMFKTSKESYMQGYELGKLLQFRKLNGKMHDEDKVPKHLNYFSQLGYKDAVSSETPVERIQYFIGL